MAARLDQMLEPGERVVYRARQSARDSLVRFLGVGAALVAFLYGVHFLSVWAAPELARTPPFWIVVPVPTLLACYLLTRSEALVTNRRLLVGRGLYRPQITELPLSMITRVPGLAVGSPHLIAVESAGGRAFVLNELPEARQLGRAVAEAAGLPLPAGPASVGERAARVLKAGGFWGTLPGFFAVLLIPLFVLDLGEPATLGAFLVLFLPYLIFVGTAGVVVGWILGSLLVLACLRLLVTADEIEEALRTLQQMADAVARYQGSHIDYLGYWSRPLVARLAAWVYGRPMHLNADGAERHVR